MYRDCTRNLSCSHIVGEFWGKLPQSHSHRKRSYSHRIFIVCIAFSITQTQMSTNPPTPVASNSFFYMCEGMNAAKAIVHNPQPQGRSAVSSFFMLTSMRNISNKYNRQPWQVLHWLHTTNSRRRGRWRWPDIILLETFYGEDGQPPEAVQTTVSNNLRLHHCVYQRREKCAYPMC